MDNLQQQIKVNGIKTGVFLGLIITALSIFSYYFITSVSNSPALFVAGPIIFSIFIPIFLVVFFSFNQRKRIGGFWTFKQATTGIFIMLLTAYFIQLVGKDLIFDKLIEPNNVVNTQKVALAAKAQIMKQRGAKQADIDKSLNDLKEEFSRQRNMTIAGTAQGIVFSTLFAFVFAIIFASLFKKDPPGYVPEI